MRRVIVGGMGAAAAVTLVALVSSTALAQEGAPSSGLFERLFGGSERLSGTAPSEPEGPQERAGQRAQARGAPANESAMRIDRLENQIRQLTGVVEQLQYRNQQLENQIRHMQEDAEYRFQELRGGPARPTVPPNRPIAAPVSPPLAASTTAGTPPRRGDAFDPAQNPNAPGAPRPLGQLPANGAPTSATPVTQGREIEEPNVGAPGGRTAGAPLDLSTPSASMRDPSPPPGTNAAEPPRRNPATQLATLPPSDSPKDAYDLAYGYILRKDYALAEEGFRVFLGRYPGDRFAPEAMYWLGESMFQRQLYRDAAETFLNVSTKYETTAKAPDALLRLGQSLAALGEREAACASLGEVLRKYPRAPVSVKQGVEREQKRVHC